MPAVSSEQLRFLKPYLEGNGPNEVGEQGMHCPFHDDSTRSASLNVQKGVWFCMVCNDGGGVKNLIMRIKMDTSTDDGPLVASFVDQGEVFEGVEDQGESEGELQISEVQVDDWHQQLLGSDRAIAWLEERRGLNEDTIRKFQIGWDQKRKSYTIPVRDAQGELKNLRWYNPDPAPGRRKIWGVPGHNSPRLYPISQVMDSREIIITEGEWDALVAIQNGFTAVTRTAAAGVWRSQWNTLFDDKAVYICQDMDEAGQEGSQKIKRELTGHAREIHILELPYEVRDKHGEDLSDYLVRDGHSAEELEELMDGTDASVRPPEVVEKEMVPVEILDSFSADMAGDRLRMRVTITGKKNPPFLLPKSVSGECGQDAGAKCNICPVNELGGIVKLTVDSHDPILLEMMGSSNKQMEGLVREKIGAQPCNSLRLETDEFRAVEELFVRPSVDIHQDSQGSGDYTHRKIISVGRHDSQPNNTVEIVGAIHPNPRGQHNEFLAWEVEKTETSIDNFELLDNEIKALKKFQADDPFAKVMEIANDLSNHVTKIYGRNELHALVDLVYHSALGFKFSGVMQIKGWLEAIVVGDTRTGKSEVGERLRRHYGAGEMVSCESATFAGIVGGLQQLGNGKEWEITWGSIPLNDRRLVMLDEVSGMTQEQIAQMSSIRSSGEAQLTKIRSEKTWARTRLIWFGNPRNGRMENYTYGVNALAPLIGNNEDIARFDLAMSVKRDEVSAEEINKTHDVRSKQKYGSEDCSLLLRWAWSRLPEQVVISEDAEAMIFEEAIAMGKRYVETPPLIQSANVRIKLARLAVAFAIRTFSTDETFSKVLVGEEHVEAAVAFIDHLYGMEGFGYGEISKEAIEDIKEAAKMADEAKRYLVSQVGMAKFLRSMHGLFRSQDLQDMLNLSREEANGVIGTLWKYRLITRSGPNIKINPILHDILREVKD